LKGFSGLVTVCISSRRHGIRLRRGGCPAPFAVPPQGRQSPEGARCCTKSRFNRRRFRIPFDSVQMGRLGARFLRCPIIRRAASCREQSAGWLPRLRQIFQNARTAFDLAGHIDPCRVIALIKNLGDCFAVDPRAHIRRSSPMPFQCGHKPLASVSAPSACSAACSQSPSSVTPRARGGRCVAFECFRIRGAARGPRFICGRPRGKSLITASPIFGRVGSLFLLLLYFVFSPVAPAPAAQQGTTRRNSPRSRAISA